MFAPVIHTFRAISSVWNVMCVYLWLQNPPDRGSLIFMGFVNKDFVFTEVQAGKQTHNSHMYMGADVRTWGGRGKNSRFSTVQATDGSAHMDKQLLLAHTTLDAQTNWMPYGRQSCRSRRIPRVYIAGDFLIICSLSPSFLLSTPQQQPWLLY